MEDCVIMKPLREQFQIYITYLRSNRCANSQLILRNANKILEPLCLNLLKLKFRRKHFIIDI